MSVEIPQDYLDLFSEETKAFAFVSTLMPDGSPQVTPVWIDYDGKHVLFNTTKERVKGHNLARDPRVALAVQDPKNPYRYIQIRGRARLIEKGAREHINRLAKKYRGLDEYPNFRPDQHRVIVEITPESIDLHG